MAVHPRLKVYAETDAFVILDARKLFKRGIRRGKPRYYKSVRNRKIRYVILHHTAGNFLPPPRGMIATNRYITVDRGWPKIPYHLYVPYHVPYHCDVGGQASDRRLCLYLCNDFDDVTWHTGGGNTHGVGVVFQGWMKSKPNDPAPNSRQPSYHQRVLAPKVWDWLKAELSARGCEPKLKGHRDFGKLKCPGWWLYSWLKNYRKGLVWPKVEAEAVAKP